MQNDCRQFNKNPFFLIISACDTQISPTLNSVKKRGLIKKKNTKIIKVIKNDVYIEEE